MKERFFMEFANPPMGSLQRITRRHKLPRGSEQLRAVWRQDLETKEPLQDASGPIAMA
jgi:hypothetical protein